jgi:hypothetical protein
LAYTKSRLFEFYFYSRNRSTLKQFFRDATISKALLLEGQKSLYMLETFIDLAVTFWQWSVFAVIVLVGFIVNLLDDKEPKYRVGFSYPEMPHMKPIPIATKGKGFFKGIWLWLMSVRQWEICEDFHFTLKGEDYVIPEGFQFDGASVPKFLAMWLSPTGVLLMGGLVHDYLYKYATLEFADKDKLFTRVYNQKEADEIFRDICIEVNGFKVLNYLAFISLRAAGFVAWNGHTKRGTQLKES